MYALISQLTLVCNMQLNVLDDLAEAMKALDGKKQTGCGFLSGGWRGASADDREDCYGRATVALTRAIQHTYIVSPLDMSGMIGMAQTLAVYHYGYHTLKAGQVQSHESAMVPSDAAAVLDWNLGVPFTSLDKPPFFLDFFGKINPSEWQEEVKAVQTTTSKTPELAQVHVTGPASPLPPQNKDHCLERGQGNVPKFEKLWRIG